LNWIPAPAKLAVSGIKSPYDAIWAVYTVVVSDRRARDDEISDHGRRRGFFIFAPPRDVGDSNLQINLSVNPEIGARMTGHGIQGKKASIDRGQEDALRAGSRFSRL
jgi:hypothetical protein